MRKRILLFLMFPVILIASSCDDRGNTREKNRNGVQTTVETERSKTEDGKDDGKVKVRVNTPGGNYNVDVNY